MVPIEEEELSSKEKAMKHSRDSDIHSIVTKRAINVGPIKIQIFSEN